MNMVEGDRIHDLHLDGGGSSRQVDDSNWMPPGGIYIKKRGDFLMI